MDSFFLFHHGKLQKALGIRTQNLRVFPDQSTADLPFAGAVFVDGLGIVPILQALVHPDALYIPSRVSRMVYQKEKLAEPAHSSAGARLADLLLC